MRNRSTFSVSFWLNTSRMKNDHAKIFARVSLDGNRVNISLKHTVSIDSWDSKKSKLKGKGIEASEINQYLEYIRSELFHHYRDLKSEGGSSLIVVD